MSLIRAFHCVGDLGAQPLHCHEAVEFVAVHSGRGTLQCGRSRHDTGPGLLSVVCPQEAHAGSPLAEDFAVKVLNVSTEWFETAQLDWRLLWHPGAVCESQAALPAFLRAFEYAQQDGSRLRVEEELLSLCRATGERAERPTALEADRVGQAVALLRARFAEELSLSYLAASVGLTPAYFCRAFKKAVGMPPHAYQSSLRVARARTLLEKGVPAGAVAAEVGFYDQSHLLRHTKHLSNTTPTPIARRAIFSYHATSQAE